jgi:RNA polymerase sigma-70 factor, ECF subfamily
MNINISDNEMVEKILQGNEIALRVFYEKFKQKLENYIKYKISNNKDAEELVSDTFLSALDNLDHFQKKCSLCSFLFSIANHKVIDFYRKQKIKLLFFSQNPLLDNLISRLALPEEELERKILKSKINIILTKIAPQHSQILIKKYIEGRSIKEIAKIGKMTVKQTESLLFRARKIFARQFATLEAYG